MFYISNKQHIILKFYSLFTFPRDKPKPSCLVGRGSRTALAFFWGRRPEPSRSARRAEATCRLNPGFTFDLSFDDLPNHRSLATRWTVARQVFDLSYHKAGQLH
jgi:hypothetical protein